jgi:gliding motility-associated-like protein
MASAKCRVVSLPLVININANPVTTVTSNSPICEGATLSMTAGGGVQYDWTGPGPFTSSGGNATMQNAQVSAAGEYYVTVTDAAGCARLDSITIQINQGPVAATNFAEASICQGDNITIEGTGGLTYEWRPAFGLSSVSIENPVASPADTTTYELIVTNEFACTDSAEVTINVIERPYADAGPDIAIVKNTSVQIPGIASGQNISYNWSPDLFINDILALQPIVTPAHDTTYVLTVISNEGCGMDEDSMSIFVYQDIFVPTAFTPNGDGLNDTWGVPALSAFAEFTIAIYNRNGELIFRSRNANIPWNGMFRGMAQPTGAYVYLIDIKDTGLRLKGHFMIIR